MFSTMRFLIACLLTLQSLVDGKAVFAHYMVGTVDPDTNHAQTDIDQAISVGLDAFALNVGAPTADWAHSTLSQLFTYAAEKPFKLFFSFDLFAANNFSAHQALYDQFKDQAAYFKIGGKNVVSSYGGGALGPDVWASFRASEGAYVVPNAEADADYYPNAGAFWSRWGNAADGVFTWETTWPAGMEAPANTSDIVDEGVKEGADAAQKSYIMGLSALQYKRCCGTSYYRIGEVNLPERITQILSLQPEFAEVITWNDGGESHYIGPNWPEGSTEEILQYGNSDTYPHDGWQPLIGSFVDAFKAGKGADEMRPRGGEVTGAMWYRGVLASCGGESPPGAGAAIDAVNYAVVLPPGSSDYSVKISSGGQAIATNALAGGLNYNSIAGLSTGPQKIEVLDNQGNVVSTAASKVDVVHGPVGGFCNFNYYVSGLV